MTKNTPEAMKKVVEKLVVDLEQIQDCSEWDCSDCPLNLREPVPDCWGEPNPVRLVTPRNRFTGVCTIIIDGNLTRCGWLLLATASSKILRK